MDMQTQTNLTEERQSSLNRVMPADFPLAQAIKTVKGSGARTLYVFADPECGYCKQLERTLEAVDNVTVYTFLMPVLGQRSAARAQAIWCSSARSTAWHAYMTRGVEPVSQPCDAPTQSNLQLGERLGVRGTPTIFTASGRRVPGAVPLERLQALLNDSAPAVVSQVKQ
jgi:thiol:disulfide interchange protein DsbC